MKAVTHPPDVVLRAYGDLLDRVFLSLRSRDVGGEELHDLADTMHNISAIIVDYGSWVDDERYRQLYLRPFDAKWGKSGLTLEGFLNSRLQEYAKS
jgi:hypothetical protein